MTKEKVAIVTGGSSGIGLQTARALNAAGCKVYEFSRRQICHPDGICHVCADVSRESELCNAVKLVEQQEGHIDILICNAGFGISGAAEFTDNADAKRLLDVNLFGVVNSVKAVLPVMRRQGSGRIVCISSVAAPIAIPFQSWYSVSKAAVSAYAAALREEVRPFGIHVSTILPGDIRTGFTDAREKSWAGEEVYGDRIKRSVEAMEKDERTGMNPGRAGAYISRVAMKKNGKPVYVIGNFYRLAVMLSRLLPARVMSWAVWKLYAR